MASSGDFIQDLLRGFVAVDVVVKRSSIEHIKTLSNDLKTVDLQVEQLPVRTVAKRLLEPRDLTLSFRNGVLEIAQFLLRLRRFR